MAYWTDGELNKLEKIFPTQSIKTIELLLPRHEWPSIKIKARARGLKRFAKPVVVKRVAHDRLLSGLTWRLLENVRSAKV